MNGGGLLFGVAALVGDGGLVFGTPASVSDAAVLVSEAVVPMVGNSVLMNGTFLLEV